MVIIQVQPCCEGGQRLPSTTIDLLLRFMAGIQILLLALPAFYLAKGYRHEGRKGEEMIIFSLCVLCAFAPLREELSVKF